MTENELDAMPPMTVITSSQGVAIQKGYADWFLPGSTYAFKSLAVANRWPGLTVLREGDGGQ